MRFLFDFRRRQENGPPSPSAGCSRSAYGASRTGPTRSRKHMWLPNTILINFDNIRPDEVECNIDNTLIPNHDQPIINIDIHLRSDLARTAMEYRHVYQAAFAMVFTMLIAALQTCLHYLLYVLS